MLGILFCLLAVLLGAKVAGALLINESKGQKAVNRLWLLLPGAFGLGALMLGWGTYMVSWAASALGAKKPLFYGNLIVLPVCALLVIWLYGKQYKRSGKLFLGFGELISRKRRFRMEVVLFGFLFVFLTWIMVYVFHVKDGVLYSGFSVYGDYAPHTAMMRSFSLGNNFPTEYPHFGGEDVKYHFMFQFLTGNLEYLGLRIDIAYNLVSVLSLLGFLMILYSLAVRLGKRFRVGLLTIVLFFFRSSLTFFRYVWEHIEAGNLLQVLSENTAFIGYTANEDWGLWNFNVYLNQRHLGYGLLIIAFFIWMYMDWVEAGCAHEEKGLVWFKNLWLTKEAWKCRIPENALLAGMFLGWISFWNGAALIGGLLILMGFAIFSDGKLDYLITAITAVLFAELQTKIFIWGSVVDTSFYWGFIAEDKSFLGVLWFIVQLGGIFFVGLLLLLFLVKERSRRAVLISTFFPFAFAFTISLTTDINVNHKYIMIAYAFMTIFWAWAACKLFEGKLWRKVLAALLVICLTATGIYDFVIILRDNDAYHRVGVKLESTLTDWLSENLNHDDLILTPEYSINEVTMSGVMMYMGWPYYAWSAGYDTYSRAAKAKTIYSSYDEIEVKETVESAKITYILFEDGMTYEGEECHESTIASLYNLVFTSDDGGIRIYETN